MGASETLFPHDVMNFFGAGCQTCYFWPTRCILSLAQKHKCYCSWCTGIQKMLHEEAEDDE